MGRPHVHGDYGKGLYDNMLYKYRGKVPVVPLQMVDNIISAVKCGKVMKLSEKEKYLSRNYQRKEDQRKSDSFQYAGITQRYPSGKFQDTNWAGVTTGRLP